MRTKNRALVLLKTLLRGTSQINIIKHCKDSKKRRKLIGGVIGQVLLYLLLMAFCIGNSIGFGYYGLTGSIPVTCALVISLLAFIFTLFKTNGYLFGFREYDMLMSLPFEAKTVASCKFLYMYVKSLPWYLSVSVSMLAGYAVFTKPSLAVYPVWLVLSLLIPLIPMLAAAFLGFLAALIGSGFKNKTIVQTVLTLIMIFACFGLRFFVEDMFRNNKTEQVMNTLSGAAGTAGGWYPPAEWFSGAVSGLKISDMLLFAGSSLLLFGLVFIPVGRAYRKINSALNSHASSGRFVTSEKKYRSRSVLSSIVFKEFRRMTGSVTYLTNGVFGQLFCFIAGTAVLFFDMDDILKKVLQNAPVTKEMLWPAIPLIIYFFIGMVSTPAFTPSLEGKNFWIVQSLPVTKRTLCLGKMLFNLYLTVPFMLYATVTFCISAKAPLLNMVLYIIMGLCLCAFSTVWGCVCGIKHMKLDWENEIEVIKQGTGITVYLLPNMFITMALTVLVVILGNYFDPNIVTLILTAAAAILAGLAYMRFKALTKE